MPPDLQNVAKGIGQQSSNAPGSAAAAGFTDTFEIVAADKAGAVVTEKWDPFVLLRFFG